MRPQVVSVSAATHKYVSQYNTSNGTYDFFLDGAWVFHTNANFSDGSVNFAGGEVASGVESMNSTFLSDLRYLQKQPNGSWLFASWPGHSDYIIDAPYYNQSGGATAFYDKP